MQGRDSAEAVVRVQNQSAQGRKGKKAGIRGILQASVRRGGSLGKDMAASAGRDPVQRSKRVELEIRLPKEGSSR